MLQWIRSIIYTVLLFAVTVVFGVIVLVSALLPLRIEQRYVIPRHWGLFLTWLAKVVCGLGYTVEGQENLPSRPSGRRWRRCSWCRRRRGR
jgi:1-acyl-sn-glycerol-3-phosphate acyltransferase